jgi:small subunit ribosomal protein S18
MRRNDKRNDRNTKNGRTGRTGPSSRRKSGPAGAREQVQCRFCRGQVKYIDYKDVETLQKLLTNRGKIYSRKRSGNCAACQRKAKRAIKLARYMALLPYTA